MIETIFFILIISLVLAIIGYVIYSIIGKKSLKSNNQIDEVLKNCNSELTELVNPKLQRTINEATSERFDIEYQKRLTANLAIEKEKERLLKDDLIYNLIKKSIVDGNYRLSLHNGQYNDQHTTIKAINLIPGLKANYSHHGNYIVVTY